MILFQYISDYTKNNFIILDIIKTNILILIIMKIINRKINQNNNKINTL